MTNYCDINTLDLNNPAPRCPVILLLDTSGSMDGEPIAELNAGLQQFIRETANDEAASRSVELEVIAFNTYAGIHLPFTTIENLTQPLPELKAYGSTAMGQGMETALSELQKRREAYRQNGISSYRPWVILMTDGEPNDADWENPAQQLRHSSETGKIQYIGIEIGNYASHSTMCRIMPQQPGPVRLKGMRFKQFFRWLTDSMKSVSASAVSAQNNVSYPSISDWGEL